MPLERALSKLGIASRTQAREWILQGRMRVNGAVRRDPGFPVVPETASIEVDGKPLTGPAGAPESAVLLLHKPKGVVTTRSDERGRPTVFGLLAGEKRYLHAVGRLDLATSGLLLLTNDSRISAWLTDPSNGVPRVYVVTVRGLVTEEERARLEAGIELEGECLRADSVELRKASRRESHLKVTLHEGKNREIRRLFLSTGHEVTRLKRVSFGGLELGDLAPGQWREVTRSELLAAFPGLPEPR